MIATYAGHQSQSFGSAAVTLEQGFSQSRPPVLRTGVDVKGNFWTGNMCPKDLVLTFFSKRNLGKQETF